jgi:hypothetical protein
MKDLEVVEVVEDVEEEVKVALTIPEETVIEVATGVVVLLVEKIATTIPMIVLFALESEAVLRIGGNHLSQPRRGWEKKGEGWRSLPIGVQPRKQPLGLEERLTGFPGSWKEKDLCPVPVHYNPKGSSTVTASLGQMVA